MIQLEQEEIILDQLYMALRPFDIVLLTYGFPNLKKHYSEKLTTNNHIKENKCRWQSN